MSQPAMDFERHWGEHEQSYRRIPTVRHRLRFVLKAVRDWPLAPDAFVFDYGCGVGDMLSAVARLRGLRDDQLGGCDLSHEAIRKVRTRIDSTHFYEGEFPRLERPCDLVTCSEVIEHTTEYRDILDWIRDHLRPGGLLVLTTPGGTLDPPDAYYGHTQHFRLDQLGELLRERGFTVRSAREWGFPLFSLQKLVTRLRFDAVREGFMNEREHPLKTLLFELAFLAYFIHDYIPMGPQLFLTAVRN